MSERKKGHNCLCEVNKKEVEWQRYTFKNKTFFKLNIKVFILFVLKTKKLFLTEMKFHLVVIVFVYFPGK